MLVFKELEVNNAVVFDKAKIKLDNQGVVLVTGLNIDTTKKTGKYSSNGVGKSFLFELIRFMLMDLPLRGSAKDYITRGSGFYGRLVFDIVDGDEKEQYVIKKWRKHKVHKNKILVYRNGKNITPKGGIPQVTKFIRELLPIDEEDWHSFVHMSPDNFSPIIAGRNSIRYKYLSNLLGLDVYDYMQKIAKRRRKYWGAKKKDTESLKKQLVEIRGAIRGDLNVHASINALQRRIDALSRIELWMMDTKAKHETEMSAIKRAVHVLERDRDVKTRATIVRQIEKAQKFLEKHEELYSAVLDLRKALADLREAERKVKSFGDDAVFFIKHREAFEKVSAAMRDLPEQYYEHLLRRDEYEKLVKEALTDENYKELEKRPKLLEKKGELNAIIKRCRERMKVMKSLKGKGSCPTCEKTLTDDELKVVYNKYKIQMEAAKQALYETESELRGLAKIQELINTAERVQKILRVIPKRIFPKQFIRLMKDKADDLKDIFGSVAKYHLVKAFIADIKETTGLKKVSSREADEIIKRCETAKAKIKKLQKELEKTSDKDKALDTLKELGLVEKGKPININKIKRELNERLKRSRKMEKSLMSLRARRKKLAERLGQLKELTRTQAELKAKYKKAKEEYKEALFIDYRLKVMDDIVRSYGPKGLKFQHMRKLAAVLARKINYYASYLFSDKVAFTISPKENTIEFMYKKPGGKTGDIRTMSSGEKRRLVLAMIPAIITLIPSMRRSNILVLDEIDSNVDEIGAKKMDDFIPKLKKIFSTIFVVSPKKKPFKNIDKHLQITMRNGVSSIKKVRV